jgi:hypothetical protein
MGKSLDCRASLNPLYKKLNFYFRNILTRPRHTVGMNEGSLQFHIKETDYFGTLATVLDLVSQDLRKKGQRSNAETLGRLRDDLVCAKVLRTEVRDYVAILV